MGLLSRKMDRHARKRGVEYSLPVRASRRWQLAEIGQLLETVSIRSVIDRLYPFAQASEALAYVEMGRTKAKVVVQIR
jgi:NADPH:quinone reductase-like Zn-dependent oxidoreductase